MQDPALVPDVVIARIAAVVVLRLAAMIVGSYLLRVGSRVAGAMPASPHQVSRATRGAVVGGVTFILIGVVLVLRSVLAPLP